jgi:Tol biopolymer transport system component
VIGLIPAQASSQTEVRSAIVFASRQGRDTTDLYLMWTTPDGAPAPDQTHRLTQTVSNEGFAALSPDGTRMVFDSDRLTGNPFSSDLFVMPVRDTDEQQPIPDAKQKHLTRGSSASWSPDGKMIAFHASQSRTGGPNKKYPGAETDDSDIFIMNVDDCLKVIQLNRVDDCREVVGPHVKNITNNGSLTIDDDPDWSPDGTRIVYVRHAFKTIQEAPLYSPDAEIYVMTVNPDGTPVEGIDNPQRWTFNSDPLEPDKEIEERGPTWSPDGKHLAYACRLGARPPGPRPDQMGNTFKICVMDASADPNGDHQTQLTSGVSEFTPTWSPDGTLLVFHGGNDPPIGDGIRLYSVPLKFANGLVTSGPTIRLTPDGDNLLASWGKVRI